MAKAPSNTLHPSRRGTASVQSLGSESKPKHLIDTGLWLVATPIGNLADFSPRAATTLQNADLILAEDTRVTRKLMNLHGIIGNVQRCDESATDHGLAKALAVLEDGGAVAFCSDAGTPGISDPGERLARGVIDAGFPVRAVPGPAAVIAALTISGLPSGQFFFAGFTPAKSAARQTFLRDQAAIKATLLYYETGPRLQASLADMVSVFGNRRACVARELTKVFEQARRGTLSELIDFYRANGDPKGEIVVVIDGAKADDEAVTADDLSRQLRAALAHMSVKDAAAVVAAATGLPRKEVYSRALELSHAQKSSQ